MAELELAPLSPVSGRDLGLFSEGFNDEADETGVIVNWCLCSPVVTCVWGPPARIQKKRVKFKRKYLFFFFNVRKHFEKPSIFRYFLMPKETIPIVPQH